MLILKTKRLIIRDHLETDLEEYHKLFSDSETLKYLSYLKTSTIDESQESLLHAISESAKGKLRKDYFWGIFDKSKNYIGEIGYSVMSSNQQRDKIVHFGYFIRKEFWNMGYTSEAVKEILHFAFTENDVLKIETGCITENTYSEKIMKKFGFIKEAYKPQHQWIQGQLMDRVEYGLSKADWSLI